MKAEKTSVKLATGLCMLIMTAGCGDNILTAASKIASDQICQLSANEIKVLNQTLIDLGHQQQPPVEVPSITDLQAAAIANFLAVNNFCTIEDLQNLPTRIRAGEQLNGLDELAAAFGNIDPNNVNPDDLAHLLNQSIGASSSHGNGGG